MKLHSIRLVVAATMVLAVTSAATAETPKLRRAGHLGVQLAPSPEGPQVAGVFPETTASSAGLEEGDVITGIGGMEVTAPGAFQAAMAKHRAGEEITFKVLRDGEEVELTTTLKERPREQYEGVEVIYDEVVHGGDIHRTIVTKPAGDGKFPALFYIQGYNCMSIDFPFDPPNAIKKFLTRFPQEGVVVYRFEKRGMGDSIGAPCEDLDLLDEISSFEAGLSALKAYDFVDSENVFIFGHSMGGIVGPAIAAKDPVKGLIVYGTGGKTWTEYMDENVRRQETLSGTPYVEQEEQLRQIHKFNSAYYYDDLEPAKITERYPELEEMVTSTFPDGVHMFGRHYKFWQQVYDVPLAQNFRDAGAHTLALWGEADFVSSRGDHELIAEIVNHYHPGKGEFQMVENSDHIFLNFDDMPESIASFPNGEYNPAVEEVVLTWMRRVMASKEDAGG